MMNELNDIAGQHEMIAENIATQILSDLTQLIMSLRQDRKRVSDGGCHLLFRDTEFVRWSCSSNVTMPP